jgi:5-methylcytosine-specific restriction endonuclease McrA
VAHLYSVKTCPICGLDKLEIAFSKWKRPCNVCRSKQDRDRWPAEVRLERGRRRFQENPEAYRAANRKWQHKNKEYFRNKTNERRAKKVEAGIFIISQKDLDRLKWRYGGLCAYCKYSSIEHWDHIIPLARGGRHSIGNLLPSCARCNLSKGKRLQVEMKYLVRGRK